MNVLGGYLDRDQFWCAAGILQRFYRVFRGELPHDERQFAVRGNVDSALAHAPHVLRASGARTIQLHKEFGVLQFIISSWIHHGCSMQCAAT